MTHPIGFRIERIEGQSVRVCEVCNQPASADWSLLTYVGNIPVALICKYCANMVTSVVTGVKAHRAKPVEAVA